MNGKTAMGQKTTNRLGISIRSSTWQRQTAWLKSSMSTDDCICDVKYKRNRREVKCGRRQKTNIHNEEEKRVTSKILLESSNSEVMKKL